MLFDNSGLDLNETTEEVNVDNPTQDAEQVDSVDELESTDEPEAETVEAEEVDGEEVEEDETEDDVFIVDGQEFTLEQLENAKNIDQMEKSFKAEYTKKTMALADERKATESLKDELSNLAAELQVLVDEDKDIDWAELEEDDPQEYIRLKKLADNRAKKLEDVKANMKTEAPSNTLSPEEAAQEQQKLVEYFPEWVKKDESGNFSEILPKYKEDMKDMAKHARKLGFSDEQIKSINSAGMIKALMDSMRFGEKQAKIEIAKKRVKPKQTKPAKANTAPQQTTTLFKNSVGR